MRKLAVSVVLALAPFALTADYGPRTTSFSAAAAAPAGNGATDAPDRGSATRPDTAPARVMILGVWHFSEGTNVIEVNPARIMERRRQEELRAALDTLAAFGPTVVAVERVASDQAIVDSLYRAYRSGRRELEASEDQQVGFRMAERMGLERVHAIDHKLEWPFDTVVAYAKAHDPAFLEYQKEYRKRLLARMDSLRENATVAGIFRWYNAPETERFLHEPYMKMTEVGVDAGHVGVKPVANYYRRNLRIFANLTRIVEAGDRVLVVYGSGHQPFLQEFVRGHAEMELVSPLEYLGGER